MIRHGISGSEPDASPGPLGDTSVEPPLSNPRRILLLCAIVLCNLGLFTISWDRIGNLSIGSFNVKVSVVAFGLSLALAAIATQFRRRTLMPLPMLGVMAAIVSLLIVSSIFARDPQAAALSTLTVIAGAIIPALAVFANAYWIRLQVLLKWFVWGAVFACVFGLYQLVAYYLEFPQLIEYEGQSGGLGRIASFSYEPAYFGYFLVLALAASCVRLFTTGGSKSVYGQVALILATLVLLNSRAVFLTLPLFAILIWPVARGFVTTKQLLVAVSSIAVALSILCVAIPSIPATVLSQFLSIFNPHEASSNAPRLQIYGAALDIARDHPWLGVGPSNFGLYISDLHYQQYEGLALNNMVANNIWLQSLMDGGILLTIAQLTLVVLVIARGYFSGSNSARIISSGWLSVVLIGGMVVSNFYDAKLWVILALVFVAIRAEALPALKEQDTILREAQPPLA